MIACRTGNSRYAASGINCLLRLIVSNGLSPNALKEVLDAFRECTNLALEVQLKVLQALPTLLQNYSSSLEGNLLVSAFQVCFLLHGSKTSVVSNTAAASLQQLLAVTFEKVTDQDETSSSDASSVVVPIEDGSIPVTSAAADAYHLLDDICLLTSGMQPNVLHGSILNGAFGLELIESSLATHIDTVSKHGEQVYVLRNRLMPFIIQVLSEKASFSVTVRSIRVLRLLTGRLLPAMALEIEIAIDLLNHSLDPKASPEWKRVLCLEFFREVHGDPKLIRTIYAQYDEREGRKNLVGEHLATLVRLAAEKPTVTGLGQQISDTEVHRRLSAEQIAVESGGITGTIATPSFEVNLDKPGLNVQWSTIRTPCIDLLDKSEAPNLPATYIYVLVLTCISRFSEGLAKFILPFTIINDSISKRRRVPTSSGPSQQDVGAKDVREEKLGMDSMQSYTESNQSEGNYPINPLELKDHEQYGQICTSASMVEDCWPALLATSSTFFNASLDSEYLHMLIKSFQKLTQVAGLLYLETPKDAFLTALAKHAVPTPTGDLSRTPTLGSHENSDTDDEEDRHETEDDSSTARRTSPRNSKEAVLRLNPITTRNLLCLRALLNLGIALGPVLKQSWMILLETLHQVDCRLIASHRHDLKGSRAQGEAKSEDNALNNEKDAVEMAVRRLFQSTCDLPDQAYHEILECFSTLAYSVSDLIGQPNRRFQTAAPDLLSPQAATPRHRRFPSLKANKIVASNDSMRILDRIDQIAHYNLHRLSRSKPSGSNWTILMNVFTDHLSSTIIVVDVRISAARKLNDILDRLVTSTNDADIEVQNEVTIRCLEALETMISSIWRQNATKSSSNCSLEIHAMGLETLTSILEQRGDVLRSGWDVVFNIVTSALRMTEQPAAQSDTKETSLAASVPKSPKLIRLSFASLQLACSDFLTVIPNRHFPALLDTLSFFCSQTQDFNISLTSMAFFRNLSDFLQLEDKDFDRTFTEANMTETESEIFEPIDVKGDSTSPPNVWVSLLLHLARLVTDDRVEVRHSALHTMFGIVDTCGERLDAEAWMLCFQVVFLRLLSTTEKLLQSGRNVEGDEEPPWDDTAIILVQRLSKIFMQALGTGSVHSKFSNLWTQILTRYAKLLEVGSLDLDKTIFTAITEILATSGKEAIRRKSSHDLVWAIWREHDPSHRDLHGACSNHDALTAYLQYICQLHRLLDEGFDTHQAEAVMSNLRLCITRSTHVRYGSDLDEMTAVQKLVLEIMKLITSSPSGILVKIVEEYGFLVDLAFHGRVGPITKGKTFIALSRAAMTELEGFVKEHCISPDTPTAHLLFISLRALDLPISFKYQLQQDGKGIPTWKLATSTALSLVNRDLLDRCRENDPRTQDMWSTIIDISNSIAAADTDECESMSVINDDQEFDIESFKRLTAAIVPILGSPSISDNVRRQDVESVFHHSLIHEPHPDDLAQPDQELLDGLRSEHVGRVQDLPPTLRSKMAYVLIDQLFDLVAVHDGSTQRVKLAQAAAPYLILRAGLVLKAYICDQPLRGRMPQPISENREMHYFLERLVNLDSEPRAFPDTLGVRQSEFKKHLFLLFGLVTKALKVARRDEDMSEALRRVLDAVGADFGL